MHPPWHFSHLLILLLPLAHCSLLPVHTDRYFLQTQGFRDEEASVAQGHAYEYHSFPDIRRLLDRGWWKYLPEKGFLLRSPPFVKTIPSPYSIFTPPISQFSRGSSFLLSIKPCRFSPAASLSWRGKAKAGLNPVPSKHKAVESIIIGRPVRKTLSSYLHPLRRFALPQHCRVYLALPFDPGPLVLDTLIALSWHRQAQHQGMPCPVRQPRATAAGDCQDVCLGYAARRDGRPGRRGGQEEWLRLAQ